MKFLREKQALLVEAAGAIGGRAEAFRAENCLRAFRTEGASARVVDELVRLGRVLHLDIEMADPRWLTLHPDSTIVWRCCRAADALDALLGRLVDIRGHEADVNAA
ncbi:hypothetical protein [Frigidibacter sp. MR17.24]|uniref:hypothetical protein n=1 Tax=Frigidibacter sp. MR17.24 TaxID=3127345 RepID=UPI003012CBBC